MNHTATLTVAFILAIVVPTEAALAQTSEMPEPLLVLLDVDGKPMVQVVDISFLSIVVLFDFDGVPARFTLDLNSAFNSGSGVFFSDPNCVGEIYLSSPSEVAAWELLTQTYFAITGPYSDDGTYRVFRSTSLDPVSVTPASMWSPALSGFGECAPYAGGSWEFVSGEEILPNPLHGFHGPSAANPDSKLSLRGGTRNN